MASLKSGLAKIIRLTAGADLQTRILIPNQLTDIIKANLLSSLSKTPEIVTTEGPNLASNIGSTAKNLLEEALKLPFLPLPVTQLRFYKEHVIPRSKGIGSVGEVLHFIGANNEEVTLQFTTDDFPGILGYYLRKILIQALNFADVIYIIDEMTLTLPCVLQYKDIKKTGESDGVIDGELGMIAIVENYDAVQNTIRTLKNAAKQKFKQGRDVISSLSETASLIASTGGSILFGGF